jgi:threonine dehydratase
VAAASGLIAASGGNHGMARRACRSRSRPAPSVRSDIGIAGQDESAASVRAKVTFSSDFYADAWMASQDRARVTGALVVHAYDGFHKVAGQGTVARELDEQWPDVDTVLVAVG